MAELLGTTERIVEPDIALLDEMNKRLNVYAEYKAIADSIKITERALDEVHRVLDILTCSG